MMDMLRDILYTNKRVAKKSLTTVAKNWPIVFTGVFYSIATIILFMVASSLGIFGGILSIIGSSALISSYLYLIRTILNKGYFNFQDFKSGFTPYLRKIWSITFMGYIATMVLDLISPIFISSFGYMAYSLIITLLTYVICNAIPETVYQKYYGPWETITYAVEFIKENWIEWFVPNIVLLIAFYLITGSSLNLLGVVSNVFNYFLSLGTGITSIQGLLIYIAGQFWFAYFMIYRSYLFEELSTSSRRKRLFMREF